MYEALEKGVCHLENAYGRVLKTAVNRCSLKKFSDPTPLLTTTKVITNIIYYYLVLLSVLLLFKLKHYTYSKVDNACYY